MAIRFGSWDSTVSLTAAFFVNAAILILAAAAFYVHGNRTVACESLALLCMTRLNLAIDAHCTLPLHLRLLSLVLACMS